MLYQHIFFHNLEGKLNHNAENCKRLHKIRSNSLLFTLHAKSV
jgi:hypothetical protein